jgi:hypothetical protein
MKAGIDPAKATDVRQAELEVRESKAVQDTNVFPATRPAIRR